MNQMKLKLINENYFQSQGHFDHDLWLTDPKNNRHHLFRKGHHSIIFEGCRSKRKSSANQMTSAKQYTPSSLKRA